MPTMKNSDLCLVPDSNSYAKNNTDSKISYISKSIPQPMKFRMILLSMKYLSSCIPVNAIAVDLILQECNPS